MTQLIINSSYDTGIAQIDEEHRRIIDRFNELVRSVAGGDSRETIDAALQAMIDETRAHFRSEERLLEAHGYHGLDAHRQEHIDLMHQVEQYETRVRAGTLELNRHVMALLKDWLVEHILHADQAFVDTVLDQAGN